MKNKLIDLFGSNKSVSDTGIKYSVLLEQFMSSFIDDFRHYEYVEDIFEFSINAWNMANMNSILPDDDLEGVMNSSGKNKKDASLLKRMIALKENKFNAYTNFIVDYELKELNDGSEPRLAVITQEQEAYLTNLLNSIEKESVYGQDDFEENYINRYAIVVKPKQPFMDWLTSLHDISDLDEIGVDVYLVDDEISDMDKFLRKKFDKLFTLILQDWHTNKKEWPQKRNYKMFKQWFRVEISEMVYDLEKQPVLKLI